MEHFARLRYAAFLLVALVTSASLVAALSGKFELIETFFSPWFALPAFLVAWLVTPWLAERLPFKRGG
jgi:amino acid permease